MKILYGVFLLIVVVCSFSSGKDVDFISNDNIDEWVEVPDTVYKEIIENPWFSNSSNWRVFANNGRAYARPLGLLNAIPPLKVSGGQESVIHGAAIEIEGGWLAAYYSEHLIDDVDINSVYLVSDQKFEKQLSKGGAVMQFYLDKSTGDIFAGTETGILRFRSVKDWSCIQEIEFNFGLVYGITSFSTIERELVVYSDTGWWRIDLDNTVEKMSKLNDVQVSGISIVEKNGFIYLGGGIFVTEIDLASQDVRRLCPSVEFLQAMKTLTLNEFNDFLIDNFKLDETGSADK